MPTRFLYRELGLRVVDWARRTDSVAAFRALERSQWWSAERLRALQAERLRRLLVHARDRVPYYRELFASAGFAPEAAQGPADLAGLPLLDKDILRREGERLLADDAPAYAPRPHRSAGTTGQPIVIQMDRTRHSIGWADMYRWWSAAGWQLGDKQFVVAGAALRPRRLSGFAARLYGRLNHFEEFTAFQLDAPALDRILERLRRHRGRVFLRGYASSMHALASHAAERGWQPPWQERAPVFTTAEMLFPEQRRQIEAGLRAEVFDQWGCRDGGISAFECDRHAGLHLAVENAVVEICREDGSLAAPGEPGLVVATDLFSYAMPLVRYRVGDVASLAGEPCACGRGLPLVASVEGRVSGFLIGSGGRRIHGEFFSHVFWETPWVAEFQIVQERADEIAVRIVRRGEPPAGQLEEIRGLMEAQAGPDVKVRVEFVDRIEPGPMGKRQFVICKL